MRVGVGVLEVLVLGQWVLVLGPGVLAGGHRVPGSVWWGAV